VKRVWEAARDLALFVYDFVIGDDWTIAVGVAIAFGATWGLLQTSAPAWWLMPIAAVIVLAFSVVRANRKA
jgi:uncharacterized protein (DUF983 family)